MSETNTQLAPGGRIPPQAVDVEQSVLGAMLIEREAIPRAIEILREDAFYDGRHRKIFSAMSVLFERGEPVDTITLTEEMRRRSEIDAVGGAAQQQAGLRSWLGGGRFSHDDEHGPAEQGGGMGARP